MTNERKPKQPAVLGGPCECGDGYAACNMVLAYECTQCGRREAADESAKAPDEQEARSLQRVVSRLEWTFEAESRRWLGRLRGHPDRTLFILNLVEGRDDRCHLLGGVMSDSEDRQHTRALVTWAKMAAEWYLDDFEALLKATNNQAHLPAPAETVERKKDNL